MGPTQSPNRLSFTRDMRILSLTIAVGLLAGCGSKSAAVIDQPTVDAYTAFFMAERADPSSYVIRSLKIMNDELGLTTVCGSVAHTAAVNLVINRDFFVLGDGRVPRVTWVQDLGGADEDQRKQYHACDKGGREVDQGGRGRLRAPSGPATTDYLGNARLSVVGERLLLA
jgi:hypothetical protein